MSADPDIRHRGGMIPASMRAARALLVAALALATVGVVAAATVEPGARPSSRLAAGVGADRSTTTAAGATAPSSTTSGPTTSGPTAPASTTVAPSTTAAPSGAAATTTPRPRVTTSTTSAPPVTAPPATIPPPAPSIPGGTIRLLITNETGQPLDISVNNGFLRLNAGQSYDGLAPAELGAQGDVPSGSDLVTVSIPPDFGSADAGCGSYRLAQLFSPGLSYKMRIYDSGTCRLLGGSAKPDFSISRR